MMAVGSNLQDYLMIKLSMENNNPRHLSMHSVVILVEILDNLNYKNNNYYDMCIAVLLMTFDVTESLRFVASLVDAHY